MHSPNRAERRKKASEKRRDARKWIKAYRKVAKTHKRALQRLADAQVPPPSGEAPEGEEVISEEEQARRKWAYGCGPGTLAGSDDL
jgi:hypothetical protein